jgi:hypothetical protein
MQVFLTALTSLSLAGPLLLTPGARAAEPPVSLTWSAPAGCPQSPRFVADLERFLGQALSARHDATLAISGDLREDERQGYAVQLSVVSVRGKLQRELSHRDCVELTEASALVVALALEPELVIPERTERIQEVAPTRAEAAPSPLAAAPAEPVAVAVALPLPKEREAPKRAGRPVQLSLSALGLLGNAVLPDTGVGVGGQAAGSFGRFRISARATYWLPRTRSVHGNPGAYLELGAWGLGLKGCGLPISGEVTLALCAGPEMGDMSATGTGLLTDTRTAHQWWSALAAEVSLGITSQSGLFTQLGVELAKVLESPRFGVAEDSVPSEVFRAPGWMFNGFVALGLNR